MQVSKQRLCGIGDEASADLLNQIRCHKQLGWSNMELRSISGTPLKACGDDLFAYIVDNINQAELSVPVLASTIGNWASNIDKPLSEDITELMHLIKLAKKLNSSYIRIMSYPNTAYSEENWRKMVIDKIKTLAVIAVDHDVTLLHENCHGYAENDADKALHLIDATKGEGLGLLHDIGNPVVHGYDGFAYLKKTVEFIRHVHVKDATYHNKKECFVFPGKGQARVLDSIKYLLNKGYIGLFSIEPHVALIPHQQTIINDDKTCFNSYISYANAFEALLVETQYE